MKNKIYIVLIFLVLLSISAASAADDSTSDIISANDNNELILEDIQEDVTNINDNEKLILEDNADEEPVGIADEDTNLRDSSTGTFTELNSLINDNTNSEINLTRNYTYNPDSDDDNIVDNIVITRNLTLNGNGYTLDGNHSVRIFNVTGCNVIFKNIVFINGNVNDTHGNYDGGAISAEGGNATIINCTFRNNYAYHGGGAVYKGKAINCTFEGNSVRFYGGALYMSTANNCFFKKNSNRQLGGAMASGTAINCTFIQNYIPIKTDGKGGAMYRANATNCTFILNTAPTDNHISNPQLIRNCTYIDKATFSVFDLLTSPHSKEKLCFNLTATSPAGYILNNVTVKLKIYQDGVEIANYDILSDEDWTVDLDEGVYIASFGAENSNVTEANITITVRNITAYWDLNRTINNNSPSEIILDRDYIFTPALDSEFIDGIFINRDMTINGAGHTINADGKARIFNVTEGVTLNIINLTLQNGHADIGGAIYNEGTITITETPLTNNTATNGGAIYNKGTITITNTQLTNNKGTNGGAIYNNGTITITETLLTNNTATNGGAIYNNLNSNATITNTQLTNNAASKDGGAIYNDCTLTITGSAIKNNNANNSGAVRNNAYALISDSTLAKNTANEKGGAINNYGTLTITSSALENNTGTKGGAIFNEKDHNVTITGSTLENNTGTFGGAINNEGCLRISNSTFAKNTASKNGGAIYNFEKNCSLNSIISNNTFANNTATNGSAIYVIGDMIAVENNTYINDDYVLNNESTFEYIQKAIDNANEGDTIYLLDQTYYSNGEQIIIDKSLTFIGNNTILDALQLSGIFNITENAHEITIKNIIFTNVLCDKYGTVYSTGGNINIINCTFKDINREYHNADAYNCPGIVKINNTDANVTVLNSTFENNTLSRGESALFVYANNTIIDNCIFNNNTIPGGGGNYATIGYVLCVSETITISNCTFNNMTDPEDEEFRIYALYLVGSNVKIIDSNFENNCNQYKFQSGQLIHLCNWDDWYQYYDRVWENATFTIDRCNFTNNDMGSRDSEMIRIYWGKKANDITFNLLNSRFKDVRGLVYSFGNNTNIINCSFENVSCGRTTLINYFTGEKIVLSNCNFTNLADTGFQFKENFISLDVSDCNFENISKKVFEIRHGGNNRNTDHLTITNSNFRNIQGSSIYNNVSLNNTIISNCSFINNSDENGGAICLVKRGESVSITDCIFENNTAQRYGGAIYIENQTNNILISNCEFNGNKADDNSMSGYGGAIYIKNTNSENTTIDNCNFSNGYATRSGGAIYLIANNTAISNCKFENNEAHSIGQSAGSAGAIIIMGLSADAENCTLANCIFRNNSAHSAGAFIINADNSFISNCIFENNYADGNNNREGAGRVYGKNTNLTNCSFKGNCYSNDTGSGGGTGALYFYSENGVLSNCTFENNYAMAKYGIGGALRLGHANNMTVENSSFINNYIYSINDDLAYGGAILEYDGVDSEGLTIKNCIFTNNSATNSTGDGRGGAIYLTRQGVNIIDCDFVSNHAKEGSAIWTENNGSSITIENCKFVDNGENPIASQTGEVDTSKAKFLTEPVFEIEDIADIVIGSPITIKVTETHIGEAFNGIVTFSIGGYNYTMEITNGTGSMTVTPALSSGKYTVKLSFAETEDYYKANTLSNAFTVSKKPTVITASAVKATYNVNKYIVATLKDKTGKLLTGVKVSIKLSNGKTYTKTTDKKGQVKLLVSNLIPKAYTATITFAGNEYYAKATKTIKVTVKKATPKMTAKAKTFKLKVKTKKYKITLKTNKNKVMKNTKVTLKVNKKTFSAKTNKKGVATFKITNLKKKGKFTAVIKYKGSKYYNKLTKKAKITVKK